MPVYDCVYWIFNLKFVHLQDMDKREHFHLLDGLRGIAALMVILFHVGEGYATSVADQFVNHGYLAVDFFFILSGFVIGYAYDHRWHAPAEKRLTVRRFVALRLIRLHPMVIAGALLGLICFLIGGLERWDGTIISPWSAVVAAAAGMLMIPTVPGAAYDVRGNGELFSLNGPMWSLFFEYIINIIYALILRRLSTRVLVCWTLCVAAALATFTLLDVADCGILGFGWANTGVNFAGGLLKVSFSFSMGMLLSRLFRPNMRVRGAFWICSAIIAAISFTPFIGNIDNPTYNLMFELVCVMVVFPLIVWIAASSQTTDRRSAGICSFFGAISYPVYAIHYPFMYLLFGAVWGKAFGDTWHLAVLTVGSSILLAYLMYRYYDTPVRGYLTGRMRYRRLSGN